MNQTVLVVATHSDDEVLGCGGVIARHTDHGDEVHVLVATRGAPEIYSNAYLKQLRQELEAAHYVLGVTAAHFLDFQAPKLDAVPGYQLADAIGQVIRMVQPELVYLPHRGDIHADHRAVYQATLVASRPINGCSVRRLLCYETLSETEWAPPSGDQAFVPTVFVDISAYLEQKLEAMGCYRSQLKAPPHSRSLEALTYLARLRGATVGFAAAEAFMLVREIVD